MPAGMTPTSAAASPSPGGLFGTLAASPAPAGFGTPLFGGDAGLGRTASSRKSKGRK
jgi:hypothetical protein